MAACKQLFDRGTSRYIPPIFAHPASFAPEREGFRYHRSVMLRRVTEPGCQEREPLVELLGDCCLKFGISHTSLLPAECARTVLKPRSWEWRPFVEWTTDHH